MPKTNPNPSLRLQNLVSASWCLCWSWYVFPPYQDSRDERHNLDCWSFLLERQLVSHYWADILYAELPKTQDVYPVLHSVETYIRKGSRGQKHDCVSNYMSCWKNRSCGSLISWLFKVSVEDEAWPPHMGKHCGTFGNPHPTACSQTPFPTVPAPWTMKSLLSLLISSALPRLGCSFCREGWPFSSSSWWPDDTHLSHPTSKASTCLPFSVLWE